MNVLVESAIKVSLVVLAAFAVTFALRKQSAALRHWILSVAIAYGAAMLLLQLLPAAAFERSPRTRAHRPS